MSTQPLLSIVVPVYNGGNVFVDCLQAIVNSDYKGWELIVVDDGSTDRSAIVAQEMGATVLKTNGRRGPGFARNLGAKAATGEYLCFIDADCEVHPNTMSNLVQVLQQKPQLDAVFGSYDDSPKATNFVAQYKNLFHHYVHQVGNEDASTFWAGCGTVKRSTFLKLNGFDVQRYARPSIEDIDLGYRIKQAGGSIHLAKQVQVKHHKAWTLSNLIKTDVCDRAIPWTQLLLSYKSGLVNDLNLRTSSRISVLAVYSLPILILVCFYYPPVSFAVIFLVGLLIWLNIDIYRFFMNKRGVLFTVGVLFMHWLYYFYSGIALVWGTMLHWQNQFNKSLMSRNF
jgi:glycosyltransferase involved in cell wall biosynthesis